MARKCDFSQAKKTRVKAAFGYTCAACGCHDLRNMTVDHWIPAKKEDAGVCLCQHCNTLKGVTVLPCHLRLDPRDNVTLDNMYFAHIEANRVKWARWLRSFQGGNVPERKMFVAPH